MNPNQHDKELVDFVIDGSNVLLSNCLGGVPSIRGFAYLLSLLDQHQKSFSVWFDNSIYHHIENKGADVDELKRLIAELNSHRLLQMMSKADEGISNECRQFNAPVINGGDKNDSWPAPVPRIFRCRLNTVKNNELSIYVAPAGGGAKLFSGSLSPAFQFRGLTYGPLEQSSAPPDIGISWAAPPVYKGRGKPGALLVLVLDASPSMDTRDTFDGRTRAAHVQEIVHETLSGLCTSRIGANVMIAVLSFSSEVAVVPATDAGYVFSSLKSWSQVELPNYLQYVDRSGTNIRLALDKAADLIDGFRHSDVAQRLSLGWNEASVVMLTDGAHLAGTSTEPEHSNDILAHIFATLNRSENVSFGFIGLGEDADHGSLQGWSTLATPEQARVAQKKGVPLETGRLYVKANIKDLDSRSLIRTFIDLASSSA